MSDVLFKSEHMIWQYAYYHDELDDILPHVEYLIGEWEVREYQDDQPFFKNQEEIRIASFLLHDDLLPDVARKAFSILMVGSMMEANDKQVYLESLYVTPPKRGRKTSKEVRHRRFEVHRLINNDGLLPMKAYKKIADKYYVSLDTIRRDYERALKNRKASPLNK